MKNTLYMKIVERAYPMKGESDLKLIQSLAPDLQKWETRKEKIRNGIILHSGLKDRIINRTTVTPIIHDIREYNGYSVSSIYFESLPGFYVTGTLYKPISNENMKVEPKSIAAILIPHGHFTYGRFEPDNQNLAATFARMGAYCIVYDMIGYGNSEQTTHKIKNAFSVQLWNSIRILDFISSLSEIDPNRIAITGASGGGTQSFMLTAIDDRINLCAPVVMVSSRFYGGCVCESGMPIHKSKELDYATNNAEITAMVAPRPLLIVSDGYDWTRFVLVREFPFIQNIYNFYDKTQYVENVHLPKERHNYNFEKRKAVYKFIAKHFNLNIESVLDKQGEID